MVILICNLILNVLLLIWVLSVGSCFVLFLLKINIVVCYLMIFCGLFNSSIIFGSVFGYFKLFM